MKSTHVRTMRAISLLLGLLAIPGAFAQQPPPAHPPTFPSCSLAPSPGNPLSTVLGTTWVFQWESVYNPGFYGAAATGNMSFFEVASPNSQAGEVGFINVMESRNISSNVSRFLNYTGRFLIFPDCTGGTLIFNTGTSAIEFDFYFDLRTLDGDPFGAMSMVSIDSNKFIARGVAHKINP